MAYRATRGVADHYQTAFQTSVTDDSPLTVVLAKILDLDGYAFEYEDSIVKIQSTFPQGS